MNNIELAKKLVAESDIFTENDIPLLVELFEVIDRNPYIQYEQEKIKEAIEYTNSLREEFRKCFEK